MRRDAFIFSLLGGGLVGLSSRGFLLLLGGRGAGLGSRLSLRRGPEGLKGVNTGPR